MANPRKARTCLISALYILVFTAVLGCSSQGNYPQSLDLDLPWPPPETNIRIASDDTVTYEGSQFDTAAGDYTVITEPSGQLVMNNGNEMTYAIYSLGGFDADLELSEIRLDFARHEATPGDGTEIYIGLANYSINSWEWQTAVPSVWSWPVANGEDYRSAGGAVHAAVVLFGQGYSTIFGLEFDRVGETGLPAPENLMATADLDQISLDWDDTPDALGYNVYRDYRRNGGDIEKVNDDLVNESQFVDTPDTGISRGYMYYYTVTAVAGEESAMSNRVDIFTPEDDIALPENPAVSASSPEQFTVVWDWPGSEPDMFVLYLHEEDNFDLFPVTALAKHQIPGAFKTFTFHDLTPGKLYFWRVCAMNSAKRGRMTDDLPGTTENFWQWGPIETIGNGESPLDLVAAEGDLTAAFYTPDLEIAVARRNSGSWTSESVLNVEPFSGSFDLAYGNGEYIVAGHSASADDCWAAIGTPGSFSPERVDGDGNTEIGHESSGFECRLAVSETEIVLTQYLPTGNLFIHTHPVGSGVWTNRTPLWTPATSLFQYSLAENSGNFYMLYYDTDSGNLELADRDGSWTRQNILPAELSEIGEYNDLTWFNGQWFSPAYDPTNEKLYVVNGTAAPWFATMVGDSDRVGRYAEMAVNGTELIMTYYRNDTGRWQLAIFDGSSWEKNALLVPGSNPKRVVPAGLDGEIYILFEDQVDDKIKAAKGSPPAL